MKATAPLALSLCACLLGCQQRDAVEGRSVEPLAVDEAETTFGTPSPPPALDTVIVRHLPLIPGGEVATLTQEMFASDWSEPVRWSVTITTDSDTLLHQAGDGTAYEEMFEEPVLFGGCTTPLECKRKWFREDFFRPRVDTVSVEQYGDIFDDVATTSYVSLGYNEPEAARRATDLKAFYADRPMVTVWFLDNPIAPLLGLLTYDPDLRLLISIFTP